MNLVTRTIEFIQVVKIRNLIEYFILQLWSVRQYVRLLVPNGNLAC